jgi:Fe-S cluster biogenesis protein NfuA
LGYGEDMKDSAKMNIWLHKQVMQQIAKHGGKLPAELIA